jgi:hypothetical protein
MLARNFLSQPVGDILATNIDLAEGMTPRHGEGPASGASEVPACRESPRTDRELSVPIIQKRQWICPQKCLTEFVT